MRKKPGKGVSRQRITKFHVGTKRGFLEAPWLLRTLLFSGERGLPTQHLRTPMISLIESPYLAPIRELCSNSPTFPLDTVSLEPLEFNTSSGRQRHPQTGNCQPVRLRTLCPGMSRMRAPLFIQVKGGDASERERLA